MLHDDVTLVSEIVPPESASLRANCAKRFSRLWLAGVMFFLMSHANLAAQSQPVNARISIVSLAPPRVRVEVESVQGARAWSFRNAYAGITNLGERIEKLSSADAQGVGIAVRKLASGEYEAERIAAKLSYELRLDPPRSTNDTPHVSWLTAARGVLMPGDLLPVSPARVKLSLTLPAQWKVATLETLLETLKDGGLYELEDAESAVFFVGADLRLTQRRVSGMDFTFATAGEWAFADEDVVGIGREVVEKYARIAGGVPRKNTLIVLAPFPQTTDASRWSAETRGGTVFFLSGRSTSKAGGLARLSVPLAHEIFHLWVPNALKLSGDYAWFYEGFTVYQSMRVSVELGYLTFQDFLDSLARAYDNYLALREQDKYSLVEASARRWGGSGSLVYHKGMLVAMLYDLNVRQKSRGKRSLEDVYLILFRQHRTSTEAREGNAAVIAAINSVEGGGGFSKRYVESASPLDLTNALDTFGLKLERYGARTGIRAANSLSRAQRDLLRQMGYN